MSQRAPRAIRALPLSPVERSPDGRLFAPAVQRNADAIGDVLAGLLFPGAAVLEIGSGTGEHIARFAARFPLVEWQPSEVDDERLRSIEAWRASAQQNTLMLPLVLDATSGWPLGARRFDLVLAINLLHMLPEDAIECMLGEARRALAPGGRVALYAPWRDGDNYFSEGNRRFDDTLRLSQPGLALRDIGEVCAQALRQGLQLRQRVAMPANNHLLVFEADSHPEMRT